MTPDSKPSAFACVVPAFRSGLFVVRVGLCRGRRRRGQPLLSLGLETVLTQPSPTPENLYPRGPFCRGAADMTVKSAVRIMVSLLSRSMAITSIAYLPGAKESIGKYRWIVSCSPLGC